MSDAIWVIWFWILVLLILSGCTFKVKIEQTEDIKQSNEIVIDDPDPIITEEDLLIDYKSFIFVADDDGRELVRIDTETGKVTGSARNYDEATKLFWDAIENECNR